MPEVTVPEGWETVGAGYQHRRSFHCPACAKVHNDGRECPDPNARAIYTAIGVASEDPAVAAQRETQAKLDQALARIAALEQAPS